MIFKTLDQEMGERFCPGWCNANRDTGAVAVPRKLFYNGFDFGFI